MALVLRKAVWTKNTPLLKCMKGRRTFTVTAKRQATPVSYSILARKVKKSNGAHTRTWAAIRRFPSEPLTRQFSASCSDIRRSRRIFSSSEILKSESLTHVVHKRCNSKACNAGCPCPFPCGPCGCPNGCGCLPPPCNTPPKCLQYMTGYYYYPYGTWFSGPYHIQGTCMPIGKDTPPCPNAYPKCCTTATMVPGPVPSGGLLAGAMASGAAMPGTMPSGGPLPGNDPCTPDNSPKAPPKAPPTAPPASTIEVKATIPKFFPFSNSAHLSKSKTGTKPKKSPGPFSLSCPYSTKSYMTDRYHKVYLRKGVGSAKVLLKGSRKPQKFNPYLEKASLLRQARETAEAPECKCVHKFFETRPRVSPPEPYEV